MIYDDVCFGDDSNANKAWQFLRIVGHVQHRYVEVLLDLDNSIR